MSRKVYSLVLRQDVVAAVDRLAATKGCSRSALINRMLAERLNLELPENRMGAILSSYAKAIEAGGIRFVEERPHRSVAASALCYKYNPSIRYTLEVWEGRRSGGSITAAIRSQNEEVVNHFRVFFDLWQQFEETHLDLPPERYFHRVDDRRYTRELRLIPMLDEEGYGGAVADYVSLMNDCMNVFFGYADDVEEALSRAENAYIKGLRTRSIDGL